MFIDKDIILIRLTIKDAVAYHRIYNPIDQNPLEFSEHIASICNDIFTIRTVNNPEEIIGDCALHHWDKKNKQIEIGGTLLPKYWGKGIMAKAFRFLSDLARKEYAVDKILAKTETTNLKALKFAWKAGFVTKNKNDNKVLLEWSFNRVDFSNESPSNHT